MQVLIDLNNFFVTNSYFRIFIIITLVIIINEPFKTGILKNQKTHSYQFLILTSLGFFDIKQPGGALKCD